MSDSETPASTVSPAYQIPAAVELQKQVKARVNDAEEGIPQGPDSARKRVVNTLVDQELNRRAEILTGALRSRKDMQSAIDKLKPDNITVDINGVELKVFTKAKYTERKKSLEKLGKLDRLINNVVNSPDVQSYQKLSEFKG